MNKREEICVEIRDNIRHTNDSLMVAARNIGYIDGMLSERRRRALKDDILRMSDAPTPV